MSARVVLVGLPGVGKTTVGRALAGVLDVPFVDTDDEVERRTGASPAALLVAHGEDAFRTAEEGAVLEVLARPGDMVVATGGGSVASDASRARLCKEPLVVHLTAPAPVLVERLGDGAGRPLVAAPTVERLDALAAHRQAWYAEVADTTMEASGPVDELVARLCELAVPA